MYNKFKAINYNMTSDSLSLPHPHLPHLLPPSLIPSSLPPPPTLLLSPSLSPSFLPSLTLPTPSLLYPSLTPFHPLIIPSPPPPSFPLPHPHYLTPFHPKRAEESIKKLTKEIVNNQMKSAQTSFSNLDLSDSFDPTGL